MMRVEKEIVYRRAGMADISNLVELRIRFLDELYNHREDAETRLVRNSLRDYFVRKIPSGEFIAWLAEYDGEIVGTSGMVVWEKPALYSGVESGKLGYILNFYTVPEARVKGICTQLLNHLIEEAKSLGIKYLHLHASRYGINIYRKAGFTEPKMPELELRL
jgi:GNAT superfamily N-acetyltransferase